MNESKNRKVVQDYMNAWARGDESALERLVDDGFRFNNPPPGVTPDKKGIIAMSRIFHTAFPDLQMRYEKWVEQGDDVAVRVVGSGTHKGEFFGVRPTNKRTETTALMMVTVRNGKVVQDTTEYDALGLLTKLGAMPELAAPREAMR